MSPHLLLIGRSRDVHKKVAELGIRTTVFMEMSKITKDKVANIYSRLIAIGDSAPESEWIELARAIHAMDPFTCIGAFTETREKLAVRISQALQLPFHCEEVVETTHEKNEVRRVLAKHDLDDTPCVRLPANTARAEISRAVESVGYPVVLKPANARGSLGVRMLDDKTDLDSQLASYLAQAGGYDLLIERRLMGPEFSVEAFSENGEHRVMCVTEKFKDATTSIETGHLVPGRVTAEQRSQIVEFVKLALRALGIQNGPTHTEIFMTPRGPRIVETHTRLGGDRIADLIRLVSGVDPVELWIRQVCGESVLHQVPEIQSSMENTKWAAVQYRLFDQGGKILAIEKRDLEPLDGIFEVQPLLKVGDVVPGVPIDSFSRAIESVAIGSSVDQTLQRAKDALSTFEYTLERTLNHNFEAGVL